MSQTTVPSDVGFFISTKWRGYNIIKLSWKTAIWNLDPSNTHLLHDGGEGLLGRLSRRDGGMENFISYSRVWEKRLSGQECLPLF